ncbi:vicilin Pin k 2.0101 isoform X1 [Cryptomeria japonica]|uniref:vicilin Pin k 2.0101 isoform X1 n=2 Tax=Cryptomeria japonica TaxID=3369 RepID=UPI0027DA2336|nr:vicilin Pin k 2.0101 isoform X1 [Cryptomeria japonica]
MQLLIIMAFGKLSLVCLVLVFLCFQSLIRCSEIENGGRGEGRRNPYIYKREEHERRLGTDRGEVRAVPIFRESRILANDLRHYEVNCFHIEPNSFMLPHASSADHLMFIKQGKATVGWVNGGDSREVHGGKSREENLEKGSVFFIPAGAIFYVINTEQSQGLVAINLLYNKNPYPERHHESFYIGGGRNPPSALSAFRTETLEAAFNTERGHIQTLLSKQDEGVFTRFSQEHGRKLISLMKEEHGSQFPFWKRKSQGEEEDYKPFNLEKKKPRFSNENGQLIFGDDEDLVKGPLQRLDIGISLTRIQPNAMSAPYSQSQATEIGCVVRGQGRIEIISPEGAQQQRRREGEGGEGGERERGREEEEGGSSRGREEGGSRRGGEQFRLSYHREEAELQRGDCFVNPAGHMAVQIASPNSKEPFELIIFTINDNERNRIIFYAGKNSELREMRDEVLAASFKGKEDEVKSVFESQNDQIFLKGPSGRGSRDMGEWSIL